MVSDLCVFDLGTFVWGKLGRSLDGNVPGARCFRSAYTYNDLLVISKAEAQNITKAFIRKAQYDLGLVPHPKFIQNVGKEREERRARLPVGTEHSHKKWLL